MGFLDFFTSTPSPERFANIAVKGLRAQGFEQAIRIDLPEFRLLMGDHGAQVFNLNNFYRDYCRVARAERKHVMEKYLKSMLVKDLPATFAEAKGKLMPVLRSRSMIEYVALVNSESESSKLPAAMPFSADTAVLIAYDTEHSMMTLTNASLADWGVTIEQALAAALDNLRDATVSNFSTISPGLHLGAWDDAYDTSRLLFPDVAHQLGVGGEPVAMIPTRGRIMVASANDRQAMLVMIGMANQFVEEEGRQISALMYRFDNGRPVEYVPADPDVAARLAEFRRKSLAEDYASQKELLEKLHRKNEVDVFVASYQVISSNETGRQASFTVWTEGVDALLPEADLVALVSTADLDEADAGSPRFVAWKDLQAATGGFAPVAERYPARYRPAGFPPRAAREALPVTVL